MTITSILSWLSRLMLYVTTEPIKGYLRVKKKPTLKNVDFLIRVKKNITQSQCWFSATTISQYLSSTDIVLLTIKKRKSILSNQKTSLIIYYIFFFNNTLLCNKSLVARCYCTKQRRIEMYFRAVWTVWAPKKFL